MSNIGSSGDGSPAGRGRGRGFMKNKPETSALRTPHPSTLAKLDTSSPVSSPTPTTQDEDKGRPILGAGTSPGVSPVPNDNTPNDSPTQQQKEKEGTESQGNTSQAAPSSVLSPNAPVFTPKMPESSSSQSSLSAEAPEFVPANYYAAGGAANISQNARNDYEEEAYEVVVEQVNATLDQLSSNPGAFEKLVDRLTHTLASWITTECVVLTVQDIIVERAIIDQNLRYSAAKLCSHLSHSLTAGCSTGTFKQHLMKRCHQEYKKTEEYLSSPNTVSKVYGFTQFMGELYLSLVITNTDGSLGRGKILRKCVTDLISALVAIPSDGNLKCAVQTLKFCGSAIEDDLKLDDNVMQLDSIFHNLRSIHSQDDVSRNVKAILANVIDLRSTNWGRLPSPSPTPSQMYQNRPPSPFTQTEPVFYNSHGQVITREEAGFLEPDPQPYPVGAPDDDFGMWTPEQTYSDMGDYEDEIEEAYELFLLNQDRQGT